MTENVCVLHHVTGGGDVVGNPCRLQIPRGGYQNKLIFNDGETSERAGQEKRAELETGGPDFLSSLGPTYK